MFCDVELSETTIPHRLSLSEHFNEWFPVIVVFRVFGDIHAPGYFELSAFILTDGYVLSFL